MDAGHAGAAAIDATNLVAILLTCLDSTVLLGSFPTRNIIGGGMMNNRAMHTRLCLAVMLAGCLRPATVMADDDKTTGVLAGLGVAAASGKTSLGNGAGAIEAGLLGVDNFARAGSILAGVVNGLYPGSRVLVVTHDEKVDLATWHLAADRLGAVQAMVAKCPAPTKATQLPGQSALVLKLFPSGTKVLASDFIGAGLTDVGISGIALSADDRLLVLGLLMNANAGAVPAGDGWQQPPAASLSTTHATYISAGDTAALPTGGTVKAAYDKLVATLDEKRSLCSQTDEGKAVLTTADALVNGMNAASATGTPLVNAMQLEQVSAGSQHVLRIAIEQVGGTSIARTGIPYTFGWPNAATVGAGLLVSFRLTDPITGKIDALGLVRCMMGQTNLKRITDIMRRQDGSALHKSKPSYAIGDTVCDYKVARPG